MSTSAQAREPAGCDPGSELVLGAEPFIVRETLTLSTYAGVSFERLSETGCDSRDLPSRDRIGDRRHVVQAVAAVANGGTVANPKIVEDLVRAATAGALTVDAQGLPERTSHRRLSHTSSASPAR